MGSAKFIVLREFALYVENQRESDKKICIGKNMDES